MILLSTTYLGNIQYYSKLASGQKIVLEAHENYQKQSYRNRCDIMAANGVISLTVPVLKGVADKTPIRDVRIDHRGAWQKGHWRSLMSAYASSPFYEFYADDLAPIYERRYEFLWDFNMDAQATVLKILKLQPDISISDDYIADSGENQDFRTSISPKPRLMRDDPAFRPQEYAQVFDDRYGFVPNLSIIDLICSEGPAWRGCL